jgi:outer membrane immunogenic protein
VARTTGNWGGFYAGGQVGYGDGSTGGVDFDGALGGAHVGYNFDLGGYVLGVELDGDLGKLELDNGSEIDRIIRLKGRAGVDMGQTMLYATAGVARARLDDGSSTTSDNGYFGGLGVDYAVTDSVIVGGELLQHRFDNFGGGSSVDATTLRAKVSFRF